MEEMKFMRHKELFQIYYERNMNFSLIRCVLYSYNIQKSDVR